MGAKPLTKDEIKSIQTDWLSGKSIIKIATELGRDRGTVSNHIDPVRSQRDPDLIRRANDINDFAFDELNDKTLFWIGFLFADGNIHQDKRSKSYAPKISLTVHQKDEEIIHKFCEFISFNGKLYRGINQDGVPFVSVGFVCMRNASLAKYSKKIITEIIAIKPCVLYVGSWIVLK